MDTHVTMITSLVETRRDCVGFVSPYRAATVGVALSSTATENVKTAFDTVQVHLTWFSIVVTSICTTSINDVFRFVPLNGDTAGLCAFTDNVADAWFSPAGFNQRKCSRCS